MRIAYFDTIAGISGDMTLACLIDAGVSPDDLRAGVKLLGLEGVEIDVSHVTQNGISCIKVDVVVTVRSSRHRHLRDILGIIEQSTLSEKVKGDAKRIFMEVARAEARVHRIEIDKVHFHEVGAVDSIVDIVGAALCLDLLNIERVYSSPVKLGNGGFVETQHGKLPIPGPAASEILKEYPTVLTDIPFELTTPTGAAIIKALSAGVVKTEVMSVERIGYGSGTVSIPGIPNMMRVMIGEMRTDDGHDEAVVIETNIDDMNPEVLPYVVERLLAEGAHDAYLTPVIMKKGRPGVVLSVLADRGLLDRLTGVILKETTTLGVRISPVERRKLVRSEQIFQTTLGAVRGKVVERDGVEVIVPEFEECRRLAIDRGLPLVKVYEILRGELNP